MQTALILKRKAQIAAGICVICLTFLLETTMAHRNAPHPASPLIWSVLGIVAIGALSMSLWYYRRSRRHADPD